MVDEQKIEAEFQQQIYDLKSSIERIGERQDELKGYVYEVYDSISELKTIIANLPKEAYEAKAKLHLAVQKNHELISRLYDSISNFEAVRCRYSQDVGRVTKDKLHFLNVELRRVEDKTETNTASVLRFMRELREMISAVNSNPEVTREIEHSLENKPEYSMD